MQDQLVNIIYLLAGAAFTCYFTRHIDAGSIISIVIAVLLIFGSLSGWIA